MGRFLFLAGLALALISCSDSGSSAPETPAADAVPAEVDARGQTGLFRGRHHPTVVG